MRHKHIVLSVFISRSASLLASDKAYLFIFMVCMFSLHKLTSSAQTKCWHVLFNSSPS